MEKPEAPFAVHYADYSAADYLIGQAGAKGLLGVTGYGAVRPVFLPASCPFVTAPLSPANGGEMFEIWTSASPSQPCQIGPVTGAYGDGLAFGAVTLEEAGGVSLETAVEQAYLQIFDFLDETGFAAPVRFWNYLTSITGDDRGLERYRRFNIGRHQAFLSRLRQKLPPAASCVGGHNGAPVIYFLAAREAARMVENPRQIRAYEYPPVYGPRSPSFSRASVYTQGGAAALFVSGTASIVGHETCHRGNLVLQIGETMENLRALTGAAGMPLDGNWALKIYLPDPADRAAVEPEIDAMFGLNCQRLYLRGDICRADLMVEIEAFRAEV